MYKSLSLSLTVLSQFYDQFRVLVFKRLRTARMVRAKKFLVKAHQRLVVYLLDERRSKALSFTRSVWVTMNVIWKVYSP